MAVLVRDAKTTGVDSNPEDCDPNILPPTALSAVEADTFWCLSRLLDGIQDNYIAGQPGIQRSVRRMSELVSRIDRACAGSSHPYGFSLMGYGPISSVGSASGVSECGVHAVRI
jgi:hypothetical protein